MLTGSRIEMPDEEEWNARHEVAMEMHMRSPEE